jgi:hypothetical protein
MQLSHSIEIEAAPEEIWEFFENLENNYTTWHPRDHVLFKWTGGEPMEAGSTFYAEQYVKGKLTKYRGDISEAVPNRKIVFRLSFPMSLFSPKFEWRVEPKGSNSVFTAITYIRGGGLYKRFFKNWWGKLVEAHDRHVGEEGENLKRILEKD